MPARNPRERSQIARIAALSRSATEDGKERVAAANIAYRDSFKIRHECNVCKLVEIDQTLPTDEIARRGEALYRRHMQALAFKRDRNRRIAEEHLAAAMAEEHLAAAVAAEEEAVAAEQELARVAAAE